MSLNSLKETLKPCSQPPPPPPSNGDDPVPAKILPPLRKPPKSSLSQQLRRLDLPSSSSSAQETLTLAQLPSKTLGKGNEEEVSDEEVEVHVPRVRRETVSFSFPKGPYEPLVLSPPSESPAVQVPASINCRLLDHQRDGVRFLYTLYKNNHGGVLGDDMGLGKTIQTIAFLAAVFGTDSENERSHMDKDDSKNKGPVLILCPTSVIRNWENEFSEWSDFSVAVYHGPNRDLILEKLGAHGVQVLVTSFDTFRIQDKILGEIPWHIVIVDEAHRLKNEKSQLYKACLGIQTAKRFGLTGTIMQNKILELFNLFDWVAPGSLGTREHFRDFYDDPLKHGQRSTAPERYVHIADERKKHLVSVLRKYLLRRTKEETIGHLLLGKEDNVVFCAMSEVQKRVYKRLLEQPDVQCLINKDLPCSCGSPLTQVQCCKRIVPNGIIWSYLHRENPDGCDSCPFCLVLPCLIKLQQISNHLELIKPNPKDEIEKQKKDAELASAVFGTDIDLVGGSCQTESFMGLSDVEHCGKMRALEKLMFSWTTQGDKILLFSYSVRMLDILEKFLIRKGYCFSRLDGSTPMSLRQTLVDDFNKSPSKQVFLISTRAGGLGLNLVSANRVVVFDPNWNPAQDLQAQDRSFRYGQKRHVIVIRLLAAGSLEELVYSRQLYKQQLSNIAVSGKMEKRYFEGVQDCKEFQGELFGICNLFRDLSDKLFTSEIIEFHEKNVQEYVSYSKEDSTECEKDPLSQTTVLPQMVSRDFSAQAIVKEQAVLHDLGIVYTHRNEEIVNMRPGFQGNVDTTSTHGDSTAKRPLGTRDKSQNPIDVNKKSVPYSKEQKQKEYRNIAQHMGMGLLEFSNWLLSASPSDRDEMLQNYKKKKRKG
ncbi:switch 2 [Iris pallida]|uniref:Switch 2 n=1 Tax=Iris pallida TaxID=29817 RepID=A0AAX6EXF3_IRIPA|nr:switch 2 [Iris pallida]